MAKDEKYLIVKIGNAGTVKVFRDEENGKNEIKGNNTGDTHWPIRIEEGVRFIDRGTWQFGNPICFWWDSKEF